jgi:hypothetical protein
MVAGARRLGSDNLDAQDPMLTIAIVLAALAVVAAVATFGGFGTGVTAIGTLSLPVLVFLGAMAFFLAPKRHR